MGRKQDKILVVDVEATCWNHPPPNGEVSDIIEIGLCSWDAGTGEISPPTGMFVRPTRSTLGDYCRALTGITPRQVFKGGVDYGAACRRLETRFGSRNKPWASFGDGDARMIQGQCQDFGLEYPMGLSYFNIPLMFSLMTGETRSVGLEEMVVEMGLTFEGKAHSAAWDAFNAAKVLRALMSHRYRKVFGPAPTPPSSSDFSSGERL